LRQTSDEPTGKTDPSDEQLLGALAADPSALGAIYDRYSGLVFGLAMSSLRNQQEAEDLTQEVFLTLMKQSDRYDPARGTLGAFLATMARTRAIDRLRARTRSGRLLREVHRDAPPPPSVPMPHERVSLKECSERVREAMAELPPNERTVLEMAYYRGLSQAEIAEELDAPLGTVKSWSRRGLLALKKQLGDLVE
jgi:RNA polymerase sigma-70 factor (ECF subfamily)